MGYAATTLEDTVRAAVLRRPLRVRDDRVISSRPEEAVVFHSRWRSERPRLAGDTLTLAPAVERAHEIFGSIINFVRGPARQDG